MLYDDASWNIHAYEGDMPAEDIHVLFNYKDYASLKDKVSELSKEVEELKSQNQELQGKISSIESEISSLKASAGAAAEKKGTCGPTAIAAIALLIPSALYALRRK